MCRTAHLQLQQPRNTSCTKRVPTAQLTEAVSRKGSESVVFDRFGYGDPTTSATLDFQPNAGPMVFYCMVAACDVQTLEIIGLHVCVVEAGTAALRKVAT